MKSRLWIVFAAVLVVSLGLLIFPTFTTAPRRSINAAPKTPDAFSSHPATAEEKDSAAAPRSRMIVDDARPAAGSLNAPASPLSPAVAAKTVATLTIGEKKLEVEPNQIGEYPRQLIKEGQKVTVQAVYPSGAPGDLVVAAVMDGGELDNHQRVVTGVLDAEKRATFQFTAGSGPGHFRITLRSNGDTKLVQLWAGPELPLMGL